MNSEGLLNSNEIQEILDMVNTFPHLSLPNMLLMDHNGKTGLSKISSTVGIIIFKGNIETGLNHIIARHNFSSTQTFFKPENGRMKVDNPSKFGRNFIPIIDLPILAEQLYSDENLVNEQNRNSNLFDLFVGTATNSHNTTQKYKMLLYKGTKILHTLYPTSRDNNYIKKSFKTIDLALGKPQAKVYFEPLETIIAVPYRDNKGVPKYSFEILRNYDVRIEVQRIRDLTTEKEIANSKKSFEGSFSMDQFEIDGMFFRNNNFIVIERIIKKYHNKTYPIKI